MATDPDAAEKLTKKILQDVADGKVSLDSESDVKKIISELSEVMSLPQHVAIVLEWQSASKDFEPKSGTFGFVIVVQSAVLHPEWGIAFEKRYREQAELKMTKEALAGGLKKAVIELIPIENLPVK